MNAAILSQQNSVEIVLNCVVERKKVADLASSIIDQRYNDQKMRLKESGFSRLIYLVGMCADFLYQGISHGLV